VFFFQAEDGIRDLIVTGVQTCALPISAWEKPDWGISLPRRDGRRIDLRDWFEGRAGDVPDVAPTYYGFVPRGAVAEPGMPPYPRSEERRVGKECRARGARGW